MHHIPLRAPQAGAFSAAGNPQTPPLHTGSGVSIAVPPQHDARAAHHSFKPSDIDADPSQRGTDNQDEDSLDLAQAEIYLIIRSPLKLRGKDDIDEVLTNRTRWIDLIFNAMDDDYEEPPAHLTPEKRDQFIAMQKANRRKLHHFLYKYLPTIGKNADTWTNARAMQVFDLVVEAHANGGPRSIDSIQPNVRMKCSERMQEVISVIQRKAILRYDVVKGQRLYQIIANPKIAATKKESNKTCNTVKAGVYERGKLVAETSASRNAGEGPDDQEEMDDEEMGHEEDEEDVNWPDAVEQEGLGQVGEAQYGAVQGAEGGTVDDDWWMRANLRFDPLPDDFNFPT